MLYKKLGWILLPVLTFFSINILLSSFFQENYVFPVRYKHDIFPEDNEIFDYVVLGHSHARDSFDFDLTTQSGINLALSGQTIEWSYKMLRHYEEHFDNETIIIIEVSYDSFCREPQPPKIRYVPLGFSIEETGLDYEDYFLEKFFPFVGINGAWVDTIYNRIHFADIQLEFSSEEELLNNSIDYFESVITSTNCDDEDINRNKSDLINLIENQLSKERKVIIYSAPVYYGITQRFDDGIYKLETSNQIIGEITSLYNINYYNLYDLTNVNREYLNFRNANHLNSAGSSIFMKHFFNLLE